MNYIPTDEDIRLAWSTHPDNHESGPEAVAPFYRWLDAHDAEIRILTVEHPGNCSDCGHRSDCALHNGPALPVESCNCKRSREAETGIAAAIDREIAELEAANQRDREALDALTIRQQKGTEQ